MSTSAPSYEYSTTFIPCTPSPILHPHRCPVCDGRGSVPTDFYAATRLADGSTLPRSATSTVDSPEVACRSCSGTGVVWNV